MFFSEDSLVEFQKSARKAFKFLEYDYHYKELENSDHANPCSVIFINKSYKVRIIIEGINWGSNSRVAFGHLRKDKFQNYDLYDLVNALGFEDLYVSNRTGVGQYEQLDVLSDILKSVGPKVLTGNSSIWSEIDKIRDKRINER